MTNGTQGVRHQPEREPAPYEARIAHEMWDHDGRPERDPDPTTVGLRDYQRWAALTLDAIGRLGLKVVRA